MKKEIKILFIAATHGDESIGVEVVRSLKRKGFDFLIGNPEALKQEKRFIDSDLNRIFPGKIGGSYEERRAIEIIKITKKYDWVIDLHGSISRTGVFIIITKLTIENLYLALRFGIKRIVIWPGAPETIGSLSTFMPAGIEIESGLRDDPKIKNQLKNVLVDFLKNKDKAVNFLEAADEKDIFFVTGKLLKNKNKKPDNLKNWQKIDKENFALFVNGRFTDAWCFKMIKIKPFKEDLNDLIKKFE